MNKTITTAVVSGLFGVVVAITPHIPAYIQAAGIGVSVDRLAEAKEQVTLWEKHVGKNPVEIVTVTLPMNRIVQCMPYPSGDTLVVSQDAAGESKSVWVPLKSFDAESSVVSTAYAASQRVYIKRDCGSRWIYHKGLGRRVIMQILALSNGQCVARMIDPARKGMVLSQQPTRCPRGCS